MKKSGKKDTIVNMKVNNTLKYVLLVLIQSISVLVMSGKDVTVITETITPNFTEEENIQFEKSIILLGDIESYKKYSLHHYGPEMLQYSIIMACKYNYPRAYFDVYDHIVENLYEYNNVTIDSMTWHIAFQFLKKGAELKDPSALRKMISIYKNGNHYITPDSTMEAAYKKELYKIKEW